MSIFIARLRGYRTPSWALVGAVYAAVSMGLVYGILNTAVMDGSTGDSFWEGASLWAALVPVHLVVGLLVAHWWTVLLPILLVVIAVPAGYEVDGYPELPIWFYLAIGSGVFLVPALLIGVAARKLSRRLVARSS